MDLLTATTRADWSAPESKRDTTFTIEPMERIAQLVIVPIVQARFNIVSILLLPSAPREGTVRLAKLNGIL
jgi:hypothetical protein